MGGANSHACDVLVPRHRHHRPVSRSVSFEQVVGGKSNHQLDFEQITSLLALRSATSTLPDDDTFRKFHEGTDRLGMSDDEYRRIRAVARIASRYIFSKSGASLEGTITFQQFVEWYSSVPVEGRNNPAGWMLHIAAEQKDALIERRRTKMGKLYKRHKEDILAMADTHDASRPQQPQQTTRTTFNSFCERGSSCQGPRGPSSPLSLMAVPPGLRSPGASPLRMGRVPPMAGGPGGGTHSSGCCSEQSSPVGLMLRPGLPPPPLGLESPRLKALSPLPPMRPHFMSRRLSETDMCENIPTEEEMLQMRGSTRRHSEEGASLRAGDWGGAPKTMAESEGRLIDRVVHRRRLPVSLKSHASSPNVLGEVRPPRPLSESESAPEA